MEMQRKGKNQMQTDLAFTLDDCTKIDQEIAYFDNTLSLQEYEQFDREYEIWFNKYFGEL